MSETELVKMSPKGQLVVPQSIRELEEFKPGDRFVPFPVSEGVLFRKVHLPDIKADFQKLSEEIEEQFKKIKVSPKDVREAKKWARKK